MIGFLKGILSTDKIVDAGIRAADAVAFTEEEKSRFFLQYLQATAPMAIARRFIALIVSLVWALGVMVCGVLLLLDHGAADTMARFMADNVNTPFSVVMGFYFLAQVVHRGKPNG